MKMGDDWLKQILNCAMDIGEQMLLSGAEVHRAEDSVTRICKALGAMRTDVFIITSSMIVTIYDADGKSYTQTRRIKSAATDIQKLHLLNELSRRICNEKPQFEEIHSDFNKILNTKPYPFLVQLFSFALIAAAFTLFFGGSIREALISAVIGGINQLGVTLTEKLKLNKIFSKFLCSLTVTFFAFLSVRIGVTADVDKIIIGNIMTLIPGIGLTNAIRDLFIGDSISGILRSVEAVLNALAIAAGYLVITFFTGGITL